MAMFHRLTGSMNFVYKDSVVTAAGAVRVMCTKTHKEKQEQCPYAWGKYSWPRAWPRGSYSWFQYISSALQGDCCET